MNSDLFLAVLALDAYNRGDTPGLDGLSNAQNALITERPYLQRQLGRRLLQLSIVCLTFMAASFGTLTAQPLTAEALAGLEPELCRPGSAPSRAARPRGNTLEQIALIDQHKASDRRKLWVLRLPAAFIVGRTCNLPGENWVGEGDDIQVDQIYRLRLLLHGDQISPLAPAATEEPGAGIAVDVSLYNRVRTPAFRRSAYAKYSSVIDRVGIDGPPRCADQPSDIPGLVTFKRIDPNVRHPMDCESGPAQGAFALKVGELLYDFIALCSVNCRVHRHYHGWEVEYFHSRKRLADWQVIHARLQDFLDQYTVHRDVDD